MFDSALHARFVAVDAVAAVSWAAYGLLLGYFGGRFFEDHVWAALLHAFGVAAGLTLAVEGIRRVRR
jgi:membrane-associated protein